MPKEDYWRDPKVLKKHAKRRREKYASDPEVAKAEKARQREIYRKSKGVDFRNVAREKLVAGVDVKSYTSREISELLERAPEYVNRLINRGLWPDPRDGTVPNATPEFTHAQTVSLLEAFADHIDNVASVYRADHKDTKAALFAAMQKAEDA